MSKTPNQNDIVYVVMIRSYEYNDNWHYFAGEKLGSLYKHKENAERAALLAAAEIGEQYGGPGDFERDELGQDEKSNDKITADLKKLGIIWDGDWHNAKWGDGLPSKQYLTDEKIALIYKAFGVDMAYVSEHFLRDLTG